MAERFGVLVLIFGNRKCCGSTVIFLPCEVERALDKCGVMGIAKTGHTKIFLPLSIPFAFPDSCFGHPQPTMGEGVG